MAAPALDLTLFELSVFARAARGRSLREIARELGLKPAHVSKVVRRLESKLEVKLFLRSAVGIQLTPDARELLGTAEELLGLAEKLTQRPGARATKPRAALGIGAVPFLHACLVSPGVASVVAKKTGLRFRLVESPHEELVSLGLEGAFELAVHAGELSWPRSWSTRRAGRLRYRLYARPGHRLGAEATEREVLKQSFVVPTYWVNQRLVLGTDQCPAALAQRLHGHETTTATTALQLIRNSDQLAFLPRVIAAEALGRGEVKEIAVRGWKSVEKDLYVSARSDAVEQGVFRSVIQMVSSGLAL